MPHPLKRIRHSASLLLVAIVLSSIQANAVSAQENAADSIAAEPSVAHPLSREQREKMRAAWTTQIAALTRKIEQSPDQVDLYSSRGDAYFFAGQFENAVQDYEQMVRLDSSRDASHWRRGVAWFYAGEFKKAAAQFERYHTFDNVDRENGIWRFFSQRKAYGLQPARRGLLKYQKTDRPPFPNLYKLFAGNVEGETILAEIRSAELTKPQRQSQLFYAELYVGLNLAIAGKSKAAQPHLARAIANPWPQQAGYGPRFMWHVGRLHFEQIASPACKAP